MKKYKRRDPEFGNMLINKALEKYGETVESVKAKQDKIKAETGKQWYQYYTFDTEQEYNDWKEFCINAMMTLITPKVSRKRAESEFAWFDLSVGLKQKYLFIEDDIRQHLADSDFHQSGKLTFSGYNSVGVDIKVCGQDNVVVYVYDRDCDKVMTIVGKVEDISPNKQD